MVRIYTDVLIYHWKIGDSVQEVSTQTTSAAAVVIPLVLLLIFIAGGVGSFSYIKWKGKFCFRKQAAEEQETKGT